MIKDSPLTHVINSLPLFPTSTFLEITDKQVLELFAAQFEPYSDYNFVSLYSWDIDHTIEISQLHGNLVLKFRDYETREPFFTFLGTNKVNETVKHLLESSKTFMKTPVLKLIPNIVIQALQPSGSFEVSEDRDNYDYIYSISEIVALAGAKYEDQRNLVNRFIKRTEEYSLKTLNLNETKIKDDIEKLYYLWVIAKHMSEEEAKRELKAIRRHMEIQDIANIIALGVYQRDQMLGFATSEVLNNGYAMAHFRKADTRFTGIYQYMELQSARRLLELGCEYLNYEQDLGMSELRMAKESWNPQTYLKKFQVRKKST